MFFINKWNPCSSDYHSYKKYIYIIISCQKIRSVISEYVSVNPRLNVPACLILTYSKRSHIYINVPRLQHKVYINNIPIILSLFVVSQVDTAH